MWINLLKTGNKEWAERFKNYWGFYPVAGGGGDEPSPPPPPSVAETSEQSIQAQLEALPDILAAQQEFGPQFTQQQLESLKEFGPQFAEEILGLQEQFGVRGAEALRAEQEAAQPELGAARRTLTQFLEQDEELTPREVEKAQQDIRGAQNVRGFGIVSGVGAQDELAKLTELRQALKTRRLNIALSTAGRAPITGGSQISPQATSFGPGQLVQGPSPSDIFGLTSSTFGTQAGIFGAQSASATARRGQNIGLAGAAFGAAGTFGAGAFGAGGAFA